MSKSLYQRAVEYQAEYDKYYNKVRELIREKRKKDRQDKINEIVKSYMIDHPDEFPLDEDLLKELENFTGKNIEYIVRNIISGK